MELKHPHIVEFYGTVFRKQHRGTEAVFVMERCGENLKSLLADHSENSSAMHDLSGQRVLKWLQQITDALHVIHNKGYVHGDLRLENVLFERSSGSVKLSSVLLRKQITVERGSKCDAFLHLSPDAIRNRLYDSKSDIYSLGSLMWEIWAGSEAYTELAGSTIDEFLEKLENGYRPSISAWFSQPPPRLVHLMQECWKTEPNERKTITECQNEIQKILDEKGHVDMS